MFMANEAEFHIPGLFSFPESVVELVIAHCCALQLVPTETWRIPVADFSWVLSFFRAVISSVFIW